MFYLSAVKWMLDGCGKLSLHVGGVEWMLEGDEIVGNFPRMWEVWNGCWKVMWLWETFLACGRCGMDAGR